jgi:hypothetical protein
MQESGTSNYSRWSTGMFMDIASMDLSSCSYSLELQNIYTVVAVSFMHNRKLFLRIYIIHHVTISQYPAMEHSDIKKRCCDFSQL